MSKVKSVNEMTPRQVFVYWIQEREKIRNAKLFGEPKPWTDDPILQKYRFCNVVRMNDKVSEWIWYNWYNPHFDHKNMPIAATIARHFNNIEALDLIGFPESVNLARMYGQLRKRKDQGLTVFNGAYIIRGNSGRDKIDSVLFYTVGPMLKNRPKIYRNSMEDTHKVFMEYKDIGSFMAGQIVADLRWAMKGSWSDRMSWAPLGPGSKRGMNRLLGRDLDAPLSQEEFTEELRELISYTSLKLGTVLTERMEAMDFQNCCCEFDKYMRALSGEGKPKQNYPGR